MVYRIIYPWYCDPPTHGILNPLPMVYRTPSYGIMNPLLIAYRSPCIHGILNPLSMVYRTSYPWYFTPYLWYIELPTHGIANPLLWCYEPLSFCRNEGVQFTMMGFKLQRRKFDPGVNKCNNVSYM